jgi:hypothetical protein
VWVAWPPWWWSPWFTSRSASFGAAVRVPEVEGQEGGLAIKPVVIGWKEYVDFPDWDIHRVKVKIDTGARTSAVGAQSYELRETGEGLIVDLRLALKRKHPELVTAVQLPVLGMVVVSNSSGMREERPVIETTLRLGPITKRVRLTVTNRSRMLLPMILGRKALEGDFIVDVSKKFLLRP